MSENHEWVEAEVQVQGTTLVIKDAESGDCLLVKGTNLYDHYDPHSDPVMPYEKLESIFGEEVIPPTP